MTDSSTICSCENHSESDSFHGGQFFNAFVLLSCFMKFQFQTSISFGSEIPDAHLVNVWGKSGSNAAH